ncbi:DUF4180 domain-containing protein [Pedobacter frigoris]|uniref:DUF4180 domain-containing protein n=1 Tax=Pedobacter frigoris TaxID=2571272 RepID=A0A4U1CUF4_9SPHI|nr:DUF4180 domain-containing protein [Pedobacter frigoris]TKC09408.1 DUF4180 domain-containing protein [Pedobacter frigoris]
MDIKAHEIGNIKIAEVVSAEVIVKNAEEGLQLLVDVYYQDFDKIIIHEKNITPDFFNLKSGIAGEILQKVSNYRMQLFIIGEFSKYPGNSIKDFIYESNRGRQVNFLDSVASAIERLSKT